MLSRAISFRPSKSTDFSDRNGNTNSDTPELGPGSVKVIKPTLNTIPLLTPDTIHHGIVNPSAPTRPNSLTTTYNNLTGPNSTLLTPTRALPFDTTSTHLLPTPPSTRHTTTRTAPLHIDPATAAYTLLLSLPPLLLPPSLHPTFTTSCTITPHKTVLHYFQHQVNKGKTSAGKPLYKLFEFHLKIENTTPHPHAPTTLAITGVTPQDLALASPSYIDAHTVATSTAAALIHAPPTPVHLCALITLTPGKLPGTSVMTVTVAADSTGGITPSGLSRSAAPKAATVQPATHATFLTSREAASDDAPVRKASNSGVLNPDSLPPMEPTPPASPTPATSSLPSPLLSPIISPPARAPRQSAANLSPRGVRSSVRGRSSRNVGGRSPLGGRGPPRGRGGLGRQSSSLLIRGISAINTALTAALAETQQTPEPNDIAATTMSPADATAATNYMTNLVPHLHLSTARYSEIDDEASSAFILAAVDPALAPPTHPEQALLAAATARQSDLLYHALPPTPVLYFLTATDRSSQWARARSPIDASAGHLAAWWFAFNSNERLIGMFDDGHAHGVFRQTLNPSDIPPQYWGGRDPGSVFRRTVFTATIQTIGGGSNPSKTSKSSNSLKRLYTGYLTWDITPTFPHTYTVQFGPLTDLVEDPSLLNYVASALKTSNCGATTPAAAPDGHLRGHCTMVPTSPDSCILTVSMQVILNPTTAATVPEYLRHSHLKARIECVATLREQFERKGTIVDEEIRRERGTPILFADLNSEQQDIVASSKQLETDTSAYHALKTSSPLTTLAYSTTSTTASTTTSTTGTIFLDCTPSHASNWWFLMNSRSRVNSARNHDETDCVVLSDADKHDQTFGVVKQPSGFLSKLLLSPREVVLRNIICVDEDGRYIVSSTPSTQIVNWGVSATKYVTATVNVLFIATRHNDASCKVSIFQTIDMNGSIPKFLSNSLASLQRSLSTVEEIRREFQRNDDVDESDRQLLIPALNAPQRYDFEEPEILDRVIAAHKRHQDILQYDKIDSADGMVYVGMGKRSHDHDTDSPTDSITARCIIDADVITAASDYLHIMSRARTDEHFNAHPNLPRTLRAVNSHRGIFHVVQDYQLRGWSPREFLESVVWRWSDKSKKQLVIVRESMNDHPNYPLNPNWVRVNSSTSITLDVLPAIKTTPQTRFTIVNTVDHNTNLTARSLTFRRALNYLSSMSSVRRKYDQSLDIDSHKREATMAMIDEHNSSSLTLYSDAEKSLLKSGMSFFDAFDSLKSTKLKMPSSLTKAKIAFKPGDSHAFGWASTVVRAEAKEVLAFIWDPDSHRSTSKHSLERSNEKKNDHYKVDYERRSMPGKLLSERDFVSACLWQSSGQNSYVYVKVPVESESQPSRPGFVRGKNQVALRISVTSNHETKLEVVVRPDLGGLIPSFLVNDIMIPVLSFVTHIQEYFQEYRMLEEYDVWDGRAIGEAMAIKIDDENFQHHGQTFAGVRVGNLFDKHTGLEELGDAHAFFQPMLEQVVLNQLRVAGDTDSKMCNLTLTEGMDMGAALAANLAMSLTPEAAVDGWITQYPALGEFDLAFEFFRPMMNVIATRLLENVSWGIKLRVYMGAALSITDMGSDLMIVWLYYGKGRLCEGILLLMMIALNLFMQLFLVYVNNRKKPAVLLHEWLIVLSLLKPAVDARRVANGSLQREYQAFDSTTELMAVKVIETFCEGIPGTMLQLFVLVDLLSTESSTVIRACFSILTSVSCTGFTSATISFDYDVSPMRRKETPHFYGYIPDKPLQRTVMFACMIANSACLLLVRCLSSALLIHVKPLAFVGYFLGEIALYFIQKVLRDDFSYWVPVEGIMRIVVGFWSRMLVKVVTDFTGIIQFRHAGEIGGIYFTLNLILSFVFSFVAVGLYYQLERSNEDEEGSVWWWVVGITTAVWLSVFGVFVSIMKEEYRESFYSTETSKQLTCSYFLDNEDEALKSCIILMQPYQWKEIREDVKEWVNDNWWKWQQEKPDFFTETFIQSVPKDMIPEDARRERAREESAIPLRRRSSLQMIAGSLAVNAGMEEAAGLLAHSRPGGLGALGGVSEDDEDESVSRRTTGAGGAPGFHRLLTGEGRGTTTKVKSGRLTGGGASNMESGRGFVLSEKVDLTGSVAGKRKRIIALRTGGRGIVEESSGDGASRSESEEEKNGGSRGLFGNGVGSINSSGRGVGRAMVPGFDITGSSSGARTRNMSGINMAGISLQPSPRLSRRAPGDRSNMPRKSGRAPSGRSLMPDAPRMSGSSRGKSSRNVLPVLN